MCLAQGPQPSDAGEARTRGLLVLIQALYHCATAPPDTQGELRGSRARLAIDRSICILTRPVVITGFNRSLLVDWWSIGRLKKLG